MNESKATQAISGRVTETDYAFLMEYSIPGQVTASEKLRHVLSFFRSYHESLNRYEDCLGELNRLAAPARRRIKKAEGEAGVSSELVDRLYQLLPELVAQLVTAPAPKSGKEAAQSLVGFEERLCQTTLALLESVLRMGLTSQSPTYNPQLLRGRLKNIHELVDLGRKA